MRHAAPPCPAYLGSVNAPDGTEAERLLRQAIDGWRAEAPKLAQWAEENLPEGFATFKLPNAQRVRLRTTNGLERINRELKRRTRVASIFPIPLPACAWSLRCSPSAMRSGSPEKSIST